MSTKTEAISTSTDWTALKTLLYIFMPRMTEYLTALSYYSCIYGQQTWKKKTVCVLSIEQLPHIKNAILKIYLKSLIIKGNNNSS